MHDFPPAVPEFASDADIHPHPVGKPAARSGAPARRRARDFSTPDLRSPSRYLRWLLQQQLPALAISSVASMFEWLPGSVGPYVIGLIVDHGITVRDLSVVVRLCLVLLVLIIAGIAAGLLNHTFVVRTWLVGMYASIKLVTRKATQLGHVLPRRTPTGEVLSVAGGDADEFGALTEIVSRFFGALMAYLVIAGLVLSTSVRLGLVVLLAAPVVVLCAMPLLRPLQRREEVERSRSSELTSMATDIVAGLRVLRGIGGEQTFAGNYEAQSRRTRAAGVAAGAWQAALDSTSVLASGLFLVALTWLGAREVAAERLSVGQLISFFGYAVFMVWPIQTFFELAQKWVRCLVSAHKTIAVLEQQPPWREPTELRSLPAGGRLHDEASGFAADPGELVVIVSALPDASAALADRLGRYLPPEEQEPVSLGVADGLRGRVARRTRARQRAERARRMARDLELAGRRWGVTLGGVDLSDATIGEVRRAIVVSDSSSQVFAGTLQSAIDPHGSLTRAQAEAAVHTAAAEDVFTALPGGWQGRIDEKGRVLSGGQRQRVVLARALALDAQILVLVEPTSAVDAHTEAAIAERLAAHRRGRTTIVTSTSPLILHHADRVAFLVDGQIVASGRHEELLREHRDYRFVVARALDDPVQEAGSPVRAGSRERGRDDVGPTRMGHPGPGGGGDGKRTRPAGEDQTHAKQAGPESAGADREGALR